MSLVLAAGLWPGAAQADGLEAASFEAASSSEEVKQVIAGDNTTAVILEDGSLWVWGENDYGQVGDGSNADKAAAVKVLDDVASASLGTSHSAAVTTDGSLYTWGHNNYGQLGDGTTTDRSAPVKVMANVKSVSLGSLSTAVVKADGTLWTWGRNDKGCLGDGTTADRTSPEQVMSGVASVSLSGSRGAAVKTDGSLYTWGWNYKGGLGDGTTTNRSTPVKVMDGVSSVCLNGFHGAAVKSDKTLWTWGLNDSGQLGNGVTTASSSPIQVMSGVSSVSLGMYCSMAVKTNGTLWTWGSSMRGALGDGATSNRVSPEQVMTSVSAIAAGWAHASALKTDGSLWVWGKNDHGQLGNGRTVDLAVPSVWSLDPVRDISSATIGGLSEVVYSGQAQMPEPVVKMGEDVLLNGEDYTLDYADNTNAGTATVTVTGKGLYKNAKSATFDIAKAPIGSASIALASSVELSGSAATPKPTIAFNGVPLVEGSDYGLSYANNTAAGTAEVTISGLGNFQDSVTKQFTVVAGGSSTPSVADMCYGVDNARLSASDITPGDDFELSYADDGTVLISGYYGSSTKVVVPSEIDGHAVVGVDDYAFKGNTKVTEIYLPDTVTKSVMYAFEGCTALRCINLGSMQTDLSRRSFAGLLDGCTSLKRLTMSDEANFPITSSYSNFNIMRQEVRDGIEYIYLGKAMENVSVEFFYGKSLQEVEVGSGNAQYSSSGGAVYSADGKKLIVMGMGASGSCTVKAGCTSIESYAFEGCSGLTQIVIPESVKSIGGGAFNDVKATIVTPKGSYAEACAEEYGLKVAYNGTATSPYRKSIADASVSGLVDVVFNGSAVKPKPVVTLDGEKLVLDTDYSLSYSNNVNTGTAKVTVTGKGSYTGSVVKTFAISPASITSVVLMASKATYDGKTHKLAVESVKAGSLAVRSAGYDVTYLRSGVATDDFKSAGTITVRVVGKGNFSGSKTATFAIAKAANPLKAMAVAKAVKLPKGKKALAKSATVGGAVKLKKKGRGAVTYLKVAKASAKCLKIDKKTGKVTVAKGTKAGTYKMKVAVKAAGNANYNPKTQQVILKVRVKK